MAGQRTSVEVAGRTLTLSNLDKVLYPEVGFTKGEVIDYYVRVAPVLLPHVQGRPMTRTRWPDGVAGPSFYEKNAPKHTPDWVRTVRLPAPGSTRGREEIDYVVVDELATLVWLANLAALELHVPQWRVASNLPGAGAGAGAGAGDGVGARRTQRADEAGLGVDLLVLDLDPGAPASIVECCQVALLLREALAADGLEAWPKTSGSKGLQLYVPVEPVPWERTHGYANALAQRLEAAEPGLIVSRMTKALRPGKVLIDWSQNNSAKTTIGPYSLRARPLPSVSTPVTWAEVEACGQPDDLRFLAADVLARVEEYDDLLAPLLTLRQPLPG